MCKVTCQENQGNPQVYTGSTYHPIQQATSRNANGNLSTALRPIKLTNLDDWGFSSTPPSCQHQGIKLFSPNPAPYWPTKTNNINWRYTLSRFINLNTTTDITRYNRKISWIYKPTFNELCLHINYRNLINIYGLVMVSKTWIVHKRSKHTPPSASQVHSWIK